MNVAKKGRKWVVEGNGTGWILGKKFSTKWAALLAIEVFEKGGRISDYWTAKRGHPKRKMNAWRVTAKLRQAFDEIQRLDPTPEEIEEYGENAGHGVVTCTEDRRYYPPQLHDTWGIKWGGRVHIDIGSGGTHLMLDEFFAWEFIECIKSKRKPKN